MPQISAELATLVGSRICHDLISPIGAISNGLELLDLAGSFKGPEHDLIAESVASANARIRFFRIAYGAAGEQMLGRAEVAGVLRDHGQTARLRMDWQPQDPQPRREVKWSQESGQSAKVYPKPLKGYENGEAPELYRPV